MPTREDLHQLVNSLPDDAIPAAREMLTAVQTWPPEPPEEITRDVAVHRMQDWMNELQSRGEGPGGGSGSISFGPGMRATGRQSFSYGDAGDAVHESQVFHEGIEITLVERMRTNTEQSSLQYILEVTGPDGVTVTHDHRYRLQRTTAL